jgi:hypothetical protein
MTRRLASEVGSWRCGLKRGAAWPEVARQADALAANMASGGKSAAFGDQEAVSGDTKRGMMVEAAPGTALEMVESEFLLEFKKIALDSPTQLGSPDQSLKRRGGREIGQPILSRFGAAFGPFDEQPLLAVGDGLPVVAVGGTHPERGKARAHQPSGAFTPSHRAIGYRRKSHCQFAHYQGLMSSIAAQEFRRPPATAIALRCKRETALGPNRVSAIM